MYNYIVRMDRAMKYLFSGVLESSNIFEVGQWRVENDRLVSKDGDVGMSTAETGSDDIRFWAGDAIDGVPNFKVTKAGIMTAVGALFLSALGYPRVEINSTDNLIAAYSDADTYVSFLPTYNSVPALVLVDGGTTKAFLNRTLAGGTTLGTFDGEPLNLQPSGNFQIGGVNGYNGTITYVKNVISGNSITGTITVTKGIITSVS